jgi:hypothetical protein
VVNINQQEDAMKAKKVGLVALVGKRVMVRTVTHYYTGQLVAVEAQELTLLNAAWVADTRRFTACLANGLPADAEVEPYPDGIVVIGRGALIDVCEWRHALPRQTQ